MAQIVKRRDTNERGTDKQNGAQVGRSILKGRGWTEWEGEERVSRTG